MTELEKGIRAIVTDVLRDELPAALRKALAEQRSDTAVDEFLSTESAARVAAVAPGTIRRWVREGKLVGHRSPHITRNRVRIRRADLERLLAGEHEPSSMTPEDLAIRDFG
jgi:excisionase family DNA binding protein